MIIVAAMTAKLTASLRAAPATVPALAAIALFVVWATDQAGYPLTHWAPGGLVVLALLAIARGAVGARARASSRRRCGSRSAASPPTRRFSFLSILWAGVPGDAWEGANRTLLYLLVFALFACWRQRGASAALLLCVWTLAMVGLAALRAAAPRRAPAPREPATPAPGRAPRLPERLPERQRRRSG